MSDNFDGLLDNFESDLDNAIYAYWGALNWSESDEFLYQMECDK